MRELLCGLREASPDCRCSPAFEGDRLVVTATDCPGEGDLVGHPACRAAVVEALRARDAETVVTRSRGVERRYEGRAAALLLAAGRFAERVAFREERLAERVARDPLAVAVEAAGRAGPVADIVAETGLAAVADAATDYDDAFRAFVGPTVARSRVDPTPPPDSRLDATYGLGSGATVRVYTRPAAALRTYHLEPVEATLQAAAHATLDAAHELLANGGVSGGDRAPARAVRRVASRDDPVDALAAVLRKHTQGFGVLADLFADDAVSDVFASAPVAENALRLRVDGETMTSNVRLTRDGAAALASRVRRASGRAFSRASPTLDAVVELDEAAADRVRVAGVTEPVSDGHAFAFRAHGRDVFTLPTLVGNGTLPADAAALLSLSVERAAAGLVAGTRGAGKTTLLGALLWELPAATRVVVLEDTRELPVRTLQRHDRDVQALRTTTADAERGLTPSDALRSALRLGEGALVLGEVRGEEARVLYEAMRVGASGSVVLGTIHGDGAAAVRERVVSDLGVPESSFGVTDLVVTLEAHRTSTDTRRRVASIAEVTASEDGVSFARLFEQGDDGLEPTGRIARGESRLLASLARPDEQYSALRTALAERERFLTGLVEGGRTSAQSVVTAHAERRTGA